MQNTSLEFVRLGEFVHGGQVLATAADGRKIFVWGGLPGELVDVRVIKKKRSYLEALVTKVHERSPDRIDPAEPESYLSTSPWQIVSPTAEWKYKDYILRETLERESLQMPWDEFKAFGTLSGYRNKMEFGFFGDDSGLHLANYVRGSHMKQIINTDSFLADDSVNVGAFYIRNELRRLNVRAGDLKTVLVRASQTHKIAAALFVKKQDLDLNQFELGPLSGIDIYFSDPRSPASVPTKKLLSLGDTTLCDTIMDVDLYYGALSFFQVNIPIFERALEHIVETIDGQQSVDFYSGVGAIGIPVGASTLVESDENNILMAKKNIDNRAIEVVHATSETATKYINNTDILIVDPPRAGLHKDVISRIAEVKPPKVVYLSCNPSTQARDIKSLEDSYAVVTARGYNFFPRTPHIECLIVLERK